MKHTSTGGRALAIIAGFAFTYGGLRIILGDTLTDPSLWTTSVQLTILMVFGTIAAGHLMRDAAMAKRFVAALGFLVLFLAGTGLVVFNSVGRQAEVSMLTASQADDVAERRVGIRAALSRAEAMLADAQANLVKECRSGRGPRCQGIEATISVYEAAIKGHHADLERVGPPKPTDAKAAHMAKIMALTGIDEGQAKAALMLLEPFLWTLFFEIGSIVSLGFAFGNRPRPAPAAERPSEPATLGDDTGQTDYPSLTQTQADNVIAMIRPISEDDDPKPPKKSRRYRRDEALADITGRIERGDTYHSQRQLADQYGVPYQTLSDWLTAWEAEGLIVRRKEGRRMAIAAA